MKQWKSANRGPQAGSAGWNLRSTSIESRRRVHCSSKSMKYNGLEGLRVETAAGEAEVKTRRLARQRRLATEQALKGQKKGKTWRREGRKKSKTWRREGQKPEGRNKRWEAAEGRQSSKASQAKQARLCASDHRYS
jgi:hypothetical protein